MKIRSKGNGGFTLIEVILSIAILSIVSVVVLRLFVASHELNESSKIADHATNLSTNVIEETKGHRSLTTCLEAFAWLAEQDNTYEGYLLYDENFSQGEPAKYILTYKMIPDSTNLQLYDLEIDFKDLEDDTIIVTFSAKHYFSEGGSK